MNRPVRSTVVFGGASALCALSLSLFQVPWVWPMLFQLFLAANLLIYSTLLCRWSRTGVSVLFFPALFAALAVIWPNGHLPFLAVILAMLSWIRSDICYQDARFRALLTEGMMLIGGVGFLLFRRPDSIFALPLSVWLFFLVQSLYFYLVEDDVQSTDCKTADPFELSSREMERLLENSKL